MYPRMPRSPDDVEQSLLSAIADPVRHKIIVQLAMRPLSVNKLASRFPVVRAAISRHLRVLLDAGLVTCRRVGSLNIYSVRPEGLERLRIYLGQISREAAMSSEHPRGWLDVA
ncbi:ArsR/SmtB family transcription factor [Phenylobacterium sp.]|jgi:DNA-binding transcriptional ArsR family regulator|uniref:ArsR/SmtB family transcription factor n=1 Tax=Phenylobacterium sp. TaxID=1871053 RepID=UPI0035AE341C